MGVGHERATPEIGAPTLVWHVAVWPREGKDPHGVNLRQDERAAEDDTSDGEIRPKANNPYEAAVRRHNKRRRLIIGDFKQPEHGTLNAFLHHLQGLGRTTLTPPRNPDREAFKLDVYHDRDGGGKQAADSLQFTQPDTLGFTLWWRDRVGGHSAQTACEKPGFDPIRVRVNVEVTTDYYAVTFFIDVGNPWSAGHVFHSSEAPGIRRKKIFETVENVRDTCRVELSNGIVEQPVVPLERVPPPVTHVPQAQIDSALDNLQAQIMGRAAMPKQGARQMLDAANYLYRDVWREFCEDFAFKLDDIAGTNGRVFANFRGVVMSTDHHGPNALTQPGKPVEKVDPEKFAQPPTLQERKMTATPGHQPFAKFDGEGTEPNALVKAYWSFIRRTYPDADYREYIACGVMGWRALYITALGSHSEFDIGDEARDRLQEVPSGHLPEPLGDRFMTDWRKDGPQNLQGRDVVPGKSPFKAHGHADAAAHTSRWSEESFDETAIGPNGEEPVRYLILTKYEPHRRQLGRIVDRINTLGTYRLFALKNWAVIREASAHIRLRGQELDAITADWLTKRDKIEAEFNGAHFADDRNIEMGNLNREFERELIALGSQLDKIGGDAVGGLAYRISRSIQYVDQFNRLRVALKVGNIETWTSYDQFAERGILPKFDFIRATGERVERLRRRLQSVVQSIQTSALVSQTEATRRNTNELEKVQTSAQRLSVLAIMGMYIAFIGAAEQLGKASQAICGGVSQSRITGAACWLNQSLTGVGPASEKFAELVATRYTGYATSIFIPLLIVAFASLFVQAPRFWRACALATGILVALASISAQLSGWQLLSGYRLLVGIPLIMVVAVFLFALRPRPFSQVVVVIVSSAALVAAVWRALDAEGFARTFLTVPLQFSTTSEVQNWQSNLPTISEVQIWSQELLIPLTILFIAVCMTLRDYREREKRTKVLKH